MAFCWREPDANIYTARNSNAAHFYLFKKPAENPKILIVTDKLLTGYDAPRLYSMYLDKPMRDHVLLQAIARVNRPYVDANGRPRRRLRRRVARAEEGAAV
jgi:hypothetical protein